MEVARQSIRVAAIWIARGPEEGPGPQMCPVAISTADDWDWRSEPGYARGGVGWMDACRHHLTGCDDHGGPERCEEGSRSIFALGAESVCKETFFLTDDDAASYPVQRKRRSDPARQRE